MKAASETEKQIVVIGGGYIGLESAAVLNKAGKKVVLLRVAGEELSRFYEKEHRDHGVESHLGDCVDAIDGTDRVTGVPLSDSETIPPDPVIVGIGIVPPIEPLTPAWPDCANGLRPDRLCNTSLPDVSAIGTSTADVTHFRKG